MSEPQTFFDAYESGALENPVEAGLQQYEDPVGWQEKLYNAGNAVMRKFVEGVAGVPKLVAVLAADIEGRFPDTFPEAQDKDVRDYVTYQWATAMEDFAAKAFPVDPNLQDSFLAEKLPGGFGSMASFVAGGAVGKLLKGTSILGSATPVAISATMGAGLEAGGQYEQALAMGASEEEARLAAKWGAFVGTSEAWPVYRILGRFDRASGGVLFNALKTGGIEAVQEMLQTGAGNKVAQEIYDKERELLTGVGEAGEIGGIVGATADIIAAAAGVRLRGRRTVAKPRSESKEAASQFPLPTESSEELRHRHQLQSAVAQLPAKAVASEIEQPVGDSGLSLKGLADAGVVELGEVSAEGFAQWQLTESGRQLAELGEPYVKDRLLTSEGAMEFAAAYPEVAVQIARLETSSRKNLRELAPGAERWSKAERAEFIRLVKEAEYARAVRKDEGQVQEGRAIDEGREAEGGEDLQREAEARPEAGRAEVPQQEVIGRPELANPAIAPEARRLVDEVDEARKQAGVPERQPESIPRAEAMARLQQDYAGERQRLLQVAQRGGDLNEADTVAAKTIVNQEAVEALRRGDQQGIRAAMGIIDAYRRTGTSQARSFRLRYDPVETPAQRRGRWITEQILTPSQDVAHEVEAARKRKDAKEVNRLLDEYAKEIQRLKQKLKELGVDLDTMEQYTTDEVTASRAINTIKAAKADTWDVVFEYWRNSILSSFKTQFVNFVGNYAHATWYYGVERTVQAAMNAALGRKTGASLAEIEYGARGIVPGIVEGWRNAIKSFQAETPFLEMEHGREGSFRIDDPNIAIEGQAGRAIRTPQRFLLFADELFKSMIARIEVGVQAYRIAQAENLSGQALEARVAELMADPESVAWHSALDTAVELAFQTRLGPIGKAILSARRGFRPLGYLFPFVTTPVNIFKLGLRKSPLGVLGLPAEFMAAKRRGNSDKFIERAAEQVIAWAAVAALASTIDPEDPWITGAAQATTRKTRELPRRMGYDAQTIRIGGTRYSYARVEPFATALSFVVDSVNALQSEKPEDLAGVPLRNLIGQARDKTFLSGISDVIRIFDAPDPVEGIARWGSNFTTSWVPNLVKATARDVGDKYYERRVWGEGKPEQYVNRTIQRTELRLMPDQPKIDVWGREAKRWAPSTGLVWKLLSPIQTRGEQVLPGDRVIFNWNLQHPNETYAPVVPQPVYTYRKERYYMTPEQYTEFLRLAGERAQAYVARMRLKLDEPTERDLELVKRALAKGREDARKHLIRKWRSNG